MTKKRARARKFLFSISVYTTRPLTRELARKYILASIAELIVVERVDVDHASGELSDGSHIRCQCDLWLRR